MPKRGPSRDDIAEVQGLLRGAVKAALATTLADGGAYASLVTVATAMDGRPVLLLSGLADHTANLARDARASLLIEDTAGHANPQAGPRVSLIGRVMPSDDAEHHRARFLARHPAARMYAGFADFRFHVMSLERAHFVGGFARAVWLEGAKIRCPSTLARTFAVAESEVLDHMNTDHADAVALYGQKLLGRRGRHWTMIGVDPRGIDLRCGKRVHRLDFAAPVDGIEALRAELVRLARVARAA